MHYPSIKTTLKIIYRGSDYGVWKYPVVQMDVKALLFQPENSYTRLGFWLHYPGMTEVLKCNCIINKTVFDLNYMLMHHVFVQLAEKDFLFTAKMSTITGNDTYHNWDIAARFKGAVKTEQVNWISMHK